MTSLKKKIAALMVAATLVFSMGTVAMAASESAVAGGNESSVATAVETTNNVVSRAGYTNFATLNGTLGAAKSNGTISVNKNYSNVKVVYAGAKTSGSGTGVYKVKLTKGSTTRQFSITLNGKGDAVTIGSMSKGTWNYEITRTSGSGNFVYIMEFSGE